MIPTVFGFTVREPRLRGRGGSLARLGVAGFGRSDLGGATVAVLGGLASLRRAAAAAVLLVEHGEVGVAVHPQPEEIKKG